MVQTLLRRAYVILLSVLIVSFWLYAPKTQAELSDAQLREELREMLNYLSVRKINDAEARQIASEYLRIIGEPSCNDKCLQILRSDAQRVDLIRRNPASPLAKIVRHQFVSLSYFSPNQRGTLIQHLINEGDPILVADESAQRLMTRSEVVALLNLGHWRNTGGQPLERSFSNEEISEAAEILTQVVSHVGMPPTWNYAAALWQGIQREWVRLSEQERRTLQSFIPNPYGEPLSANLFSRLLDISAKDAHELREAYLLEGFDKRTWSNTMRYIGLAGKALNIQGIFSGLSAGGGP